MEKKITLIKGNIRRAFSPRAAEIAIRHMGWIEPLAPIKPSELFKKTLPPEINKPVKLIHPPEPETKALINKVAEIIAPSGWRIPTAEDMESIQDHIKNIPVPEKKTRKKRVPSKAKK
jgi:hypothetical protein